MNDRIDGDVESSDDLRELKLMNDEYLSWGAVVVELRRLGIEINGAKALAGALVRWGEELAMLRRSQSLDKTRLWRDNVRRQYPQQATQKRNGEHMEWVL